MKSFNRGYGRIAQVSAIVALGIAAGACGSDSSPSTATTSTQTATDTTAASASNAAKSVADASDAELIVWQTDLNAVACYVGKIDGTLGPLTEAAIRAFQTEKGLTVDGKLGPQTEAALSQAADVGAFVCKAAPDANTVSKPVARVSAAAYDKSFTVTSCSNAGESDLELRGTADSLNLTVSAKDMKGTLAISGGDEEDGIELSGNVTSLSVGDSGDIQAKGTFTGATMAGEAFTLVGACA